MNDYKCTTTEGENILKSNEKNTQLKIDFNNVQTNTKNNNVQTSNPLIYNQPKALDITPPNEYHLEWNPKEDITTFELAKCMPMLLIMNRQFTIQEFFFDVDEPYMRHFKIIKL